MAGESYSIHNYRHRGKAKGFTKRNARLSCLTYAVCIKHNDERENVATKSQPFYYERYLTILQFNENIRTKATLLSRCLDSS